jgi:CBS domain containing-hemolysin-like protein
VPEVGDEVDVEGAQLVVQKMDGRRVGSVRIRRVEPQEAVEVADDEAGDRG